MGGKASQKCLASSVTEEEREAEEEREEEEGQKEEKEVKEVEKEGKEDSCLMSSVTEE